MFVHPSTDKNNWTFTYPLLSNVLSMSTTTIRIFRNDISEEDIMVAKDNPSSNILILSALSQISKLEDRIKKEDIKEIEQDYTRKYYIIFINEDVVEDFSKYMNYTIDSSGLLKKEDIRDEATKILAG